ncbi:hypothetical protein GF318_03330 [Candidatus Micrarchaeota archaeon]|nr:hypothetical protein [Candidatus Micrarchaeota archaeon]
MNSAFREGREGDFSTERLVEGLVDFEWQRGRMCTSDTFAGELTTTGLRREAEGIGADADNLIHAVRM